MHPIRFKGPSSVFSNFNPHWIEDKELGLKFYSVEQGYQHQCALFNGFDDVAEEILSVPPVYDVGRQCKKIAKKINVKRQSWAHNKEAIIYDFMKLKSQQHEQFRKALLATDRPLHHTVASEYWGVGRIGKGSNRCGKLLMDLRQSIQSSWPAHKDNVLVYTDSIFKHLPHQIEEVGFTVRALPGGSVNGRKKIAKVMHQQLDPGYKPDVVILHVGTNDLAFIELYPQFFNQTINQHIQLAEMLTIKFPTARVMVSLPLPRGDQLENLRCQYSHQLERSLSEININVMSWECFPLNYLSHDLLHPSDDEGLPFLHWELKERMSLFL